MKFKALRKIETKEFIIVYHFEGGGMEFFTVEFPDPKPMSATIDGLKQYYNDNYKDVDISHMNFDELELVEMECYKAGVVGADIRNKLCPVKNLIRLLKEYFGEVDEVRRHKIYGYITTEIKNTDKSIKYISDLL